MADVSSNISFNLEMNIDDTVSNIKNVMKQLSDIGSAVDKGLNEPFKVTLGEIENITKSLNQLRESQAKYNEEMSSKHQKSKDGALYKEFEELEKAYTKKEEAIKKHNESIAKLKEGQAKAQEERETREINKLVEECLKLTQVSEKLSDKAFHAGDAMRMLKENSYFSQSSEEIEALKKENAERKNNLDAIFKQAEAIGELKRKHNEYVKNVTTLGIENKTSSAISLSNISATQGTLSDAPEQISNSANELDNNVSKFNVDGKALIDTLVKIGTSGNITSESIKSLAGSLGASAATLGYIGVAVTIVIAAFKKLSDEIDKAENTLVKIGKTFGNGVVESIDFTINSIESLKDICKEAINTLEEFAEAGIKVEDAYFQMSALLGEEATDSLSEFTQKLEEIQGISSTDLISTLNDITAAVGAMGLAGDDLVKASEGLTIIGQNLSIFAGSFEKASQDLGNAISKGYIGRNSSLYRVFTKNELTEFKALNNELERYNYILARANRINDLYNEYLDTTSGKIAVMRMQYKELMNNIGYIAMQIYGAVAPILTNILKLANTAITSIMKLFNIEPESYNLNSVADTITESLNNEAEAAKEAKRQTASFDDVIQISSSDSGTNTIGGMDYAKINELLDSINSKQKKCSDEWDKLYARIKDDIERGDFRQAGKDLADFFNEQLNGIDWDTIINKSGEAGKSLAEFLNGLISNDELWRNVGSTIANSINTLSEFLYKFGKEFDWHQFGYGLAESWIEFWSTLDSEKIGNTAYEWFSGIFESLSTFIKDMSSVSKETGNNGWQDTGNSIAEIFTTFFDNLTDEDLNNIADGIIGLIDGAFQIAGTVIENLDESSFKEKLKELVKKLVLGLKDNADDWGETINEILSFILDTAIELIDTADATGLSDAISSFFEKLDIGELVWKIIEIALRLLKYKVQIWFETKFKPFIIVWGKIKILTILSELAAILGLGTRIKNYISGLWTSIKEGLKTIRNNFASWWNANIANIGLSIDVPDWAEKIGFNDFSISIPKIPMLATGGIVTKSTIANIGEAGREAVLPLDRNTQWMDSFADKLASRLGNNISQPITIDMSKCTKEFYTRSEMITMGEYFGKCLKLAGLNVAVI